jgi:hypothetical protein
MTFFRFARVGVGRRRGDRILAACRSEISETRFPGAAFPASASPVAEQGFAICA